MTARERLDLALIDALETGLIVPCLRRPEWTSDDPDERAHAATECEGCPCLDECADVALEDVETYGKTQVWGVYAGVDITPTKGKPGRPRKESAA